MSIAIKVCGLTRTDAAAAAARAGAAFAGFVFYERSRRHLVPEAAAAIAAGLPEHVARVALFVDPDDADIAPVMDALKPGYIQLHGAETPGRVAAVAARFGVPVIKALPVARAGDLAAAERYPMASWLLFDARAGDNEPPGGNGRAFDWTILRGRSFSRPWMLSGGLDPANVGEALAISGARAVDVSSGVESRPGLKDPAKIAAFAAAVRSAA